MGDYKDELPSRQIREKVGDGKVLLALSGGVDSSVAAALVAEAVGSQLTCVFVDHGLMRKNEGDEVEDAFAKWDINFIRMQRGGALPRPLWPASPSRSASARSSVQRVHPYL